MEKEEKLLERVRNHWLYLVVITAIASGSLTYGVIDRVWIERLKMDIASEKEKTKDLRSHNDGFKKTQPGRERELQLRIEELERSLNSTNPKIINLQHKIDYLNDQNKKLEAERNELQNALTSRQENQDKLPKDDNNKILKELQLSQEKIKELEKNIASLKHNNSFQPPEPKTYFSSKSQAKLGDFIFSIDNCQRSGEKIYCSVIIVNNSSDERKLHIDSSSWGLYKEYHSSLIDEKANEYIASRVKFGGMDWKSGNVFGKVQPQIPLKIAFEFPNVSGSAHIFSLQIAVDMGDREVKWKYPILKKISLNQ